MNSNVFKRAILASRLISEAFYKGEVVHAPTGFTMPTPAQAYGKQIVPRAVLYLNDNVKINSNLVGSGELKPNWVSIGYIATCDKDKEVYVVHRGTGTLMEWVQNFDILSAPFKHIPSAGNVEVGFGNMYDSIVCCDSYDGIAAASKRTPSDTVNVLGGYIKPSGAPWKTIFCGHSLGCVLSFQRAVHTTYQLGLAPDQVEVFAFAPPKPGTQAFADKYNALVPNTWSIVNPLDIVPHVPPGDQYQPVGQKIKVNVDGTVRLDFASLHFLSTYMHLLTKAANAADPATFPASDILPVDPLLQAQPVDLQIYDMLQKVGLDTKLEDIASNMLDRLMNAHAFDGLDANASSQLLKQELLKEALRALGISMDHLDDIFGGDLFGAILRNTRVGDTYSPNEVGRLLGLLSNLKSAGSSLRPKL